MTSWLREKNDALRKDGVKCRQCVMQVLDVSLMVVANQIARKRACLWMLD